MQRILVRDPRKGVGVVRWGSALALVVLAGCRLIGVDELMERMDQDGDGVPAQTDCDDHDPERIVETDWYADADGDGYGDSSTATLACQPPDGHVDQPGDCDDAATAVHPGAEEVCNQVDDDCDGQTDEVEGDDVPTWYKDRDGDGFGGQLLSQQRCEPSEDYVANSDDCDDEDPEVHPDAVEVCNGKDDDCDGDVDLGVQGAFIWYADTDGDGWGDETQTTEACEPPTAHVDQPGDCDDADPDVSPEGLDLCGDGLDQDCNGLVDDCYLSGEILLEDVPTELEGGLSEAANGAVVIGLGDTNGDGYADVAVAAPTANAPRHGSGAVFVVHGPVTDALMLGSSVPRLSGASSGEAAGSALAAVGDHDADGLGDLFIGAPGGGTEGGGAAYLVLAPFTDDMDLDQADAVILGSVAGEGAGQAVAGGGDVDGDGCLDLAVGSPGRGDAVSVPGGVYGFAGPASGDLSLDDAAWLLEGEDDGDRAGASLSLHGDLDGDGLADPVVGAPGRSDGSGSIYIHYGVPEGHLPLASADRRIDAEDGVEAGAVLTTAGDVDGDGLADLLLGAPAYLGRTGVAFLFLDFDGESMVLGDASASFRGEASCDEASRTVSLVDDLDGDGRHELLIGAPYADGGGSDAGAGYLFHGGLTGGFMLAAADLIILGEDGEDHAGCSLAGAGDMDGDGRGDLIIGADQAGTGETGRAYLLLAAGY